MGAYEIQANSSTIYTTHGLALFFPVQESVSEYRNWTTDSNDKLQTSQVPQSLMLNDVVKIMQCTCILNKNWSYKYIWWLLIIKHKGVE